ncbi:hypothetical protein GE061_011864 [Apolygus lucorum]|uniref:G-protein coupled receptors family 1 profile domain-containing protein n=1 Tax=Apolygus lucorum TaxID=248454 RepID=A0A6A4JUL0_APOLU|nr:hypothetical protein GE061_011864 [Apolygus lucorum]
MSEVQPHHSKQSSDTPSICPPEQNEDLKRLIVVRLKDACRVAAFVFFVFAIVFGGTILIAMGIINFNNCPLQRCLPIYLIAEGALLLATLPNVLIPNEQLEMYTKKYNLILCYRIFLCTWELALLVFGSVLVYGMTPNFYPAHGPYCLKPCYFMALFVVTMTWISLALGVLFVATIGCCFIYCPSITRSEKNII